MKIAARIATLALVLGAAGSAAAKDHPHPHRDIFYAVVGRAGPDAPAARTSSPRDQDALGTLTGGPVGGLPDRN